MEELDLKKLIGIFWNKRLHILVITVVTMIIGAIYSFYFVTPQYESYTKVVLVKDASGSENGDQVITSSDLGLAQKLIGTYSQLVKSKTILRKTINNLGINESESSLEKKISVKEITDTEMIKITVKDEDPVQAMRIANEVTDVFAATVSDIYKLNNVYVVDSAEQSLTPCNVNPLRDILIFMAIGIVISAVYTLVANMFDTTIKEAEDIESRAELITLVSIPLVTDENKKGGAY